MVLGPVLSTCRDTASANNQRIGNMAMLREYWSDQQEVPRPPSFPLPSQAVSTPHSRYSYNQRPGEL